MAENTDDQQKANIPEYFKLAIPDDFISGKERKLGLIYWIHSHHNPELQRYEFSANTNSKDLSEWIRQNRVYIEVSRHDDTKIIYLNNDENSN